MQRWPSRSPGGRLIGRVVLMNATYPQYMAAGGELLRSDVPARHLPARLLELIAEYSKARGLDPYLVSA